MNGSIILEDTYCRLLVGYHADKDDNDNMTIDFRYVHMTVGNVSVPLKEFQQELIYQSFKSEIEDRAVKDVELEERIRKESALLHDHAYRTAGRSKGE